MAQLALRMALIFVWSVVLCSAYDVQSEMASQGASHTEWSVPQNSFPPEHFVLLEIVQPEPLNFRMAVSLIGLYGEVGADEGAAEGADEGTPVAATGASVAATGASVAATGAATGASVTGRV